MGIKKFVLSIDSSLAVEKYIIKHGGKVWRSKVGEANVIQMMIENNAEAGGEGSSGGFILKDFNMCRDGLLTSGLIASMIDDESVQKDIEFFESFSQIRDFRVIKDFRVIRDFMVIRDFSIIIYFCVIRDFSGF